MGVRFHLSFEVQAIVSYLMWVLRLELRSSVRTAGAFITESSLHFQ